jgi:Ser/Thr protein kinase RdoA (MazF antagonist)
VYKETFHQITTRLSQGQDLEDLLTTLFIFRYLERMGDALLNIGEALIFAAMGEKIKIHQFQALRKTLDKTGFDGSLSDVEFESYWGTRSGCRISRVDQGRGSRLGTQGSIFKEGHRAKILAEKSNLEHWAEAFPGLAPRVISYHEQGSNASMLVEFVPGATMDEIVLGPDRLLVGRGLAALERTLERVWRETRRAEPVPIDYMQQLVRRLEQAREVHPALYYVEAYVGQTKARASEELISECARIEGQLPAPFSVRIHGDLNCNNIAYDSDADQIHFVDLYRSKDFDYVQDISVFLVSNYRMPVLEGRERRQINQVTREFYRFARRQAGAWDDATFLARMALALARSFYTSIRFELDEDFAKDMVQRSHYLMEKLVRHAAAQKPWEDFPFAEQILYY